MSDLDVINKYYGELAPTVTLIGEIEAIDFFPHPLEDSNGNIIIDSEGNNLCDWTPGEQVDSFHGELIPLVKITGSLRSI